MPHHRLFALSLLVLFAAVGCKETPAPDCEFADDGVCDEPVNCGLGTDEEDCVAACESGEDLHLFAAACAHRDPVEEPPDDSDPSGGSWHRTGWSDHTVEAPDGEDLAATVTRHYRMYVPRAYDPDRAHPLVLMLPGHRVSHYSLAAYTELPRAADENGFVLADCEQQYRWSGEHRWAWFTDWDWYDEAEDNPDFDYLLAVIDQVAGDMNIDRRRVYLAGHSRGGAMAFIGALELHETIAGACIQSGFTEFGYMTARLDSWEHRRVPMVFMHGSDDPDVGVSHGDDMVEQLEDLGWQHDEDLVYHRLDDVAHRWQPWLNQIWWDFLFARPLPEGE